MLKKYKDFSMLFFGRLISNCGDSIYAIILSWYMLEVTKSAWSVGLLNFLIFIPNTFAFIFGKKIDSSPKKKLLIVLEFIQLLAVAGILVGISIRNAHENLSLSLIFVCVFIASTVGLNTYTVQDALVPKLVRLHDLPKAEMYMSFAYSGTEYLFSAISGFLLSAISYIPLLIIDIFTFLGSILFFKRIKFEEKIEQTEDEDSDVLSGLRFILRNKVAFALTFGAAFANFLFGGLNVYELLIAKELGGPGLYGLIVAAGAVGALLGSTVICNYVLKKLTIGKTLWIATILFAVGIGATAFAKNQVSLLIIWLLTFVFLGITGVIQKPILQAEIPENRRGAVFSAYYTVSIPTLAIGSLFFGFIAKFLTWRGFIFVFAIGTILLGLLYFLTKPLRRYNLSASEIEL